MNRLHNLDRFAARLCQCIGGAAPANSASDVTEVVSCALSPPAQFTGRPDCQQFNHLGLDLFRLQFEFNPAYRRQCLARGIDPNQVSTWQQIPAVPTAGFKDLELSSLAPEQRTSVFFSSGTTDQRTSRHFHNADSLRVYEQSLLTGFNHQFGNGCPKRALALTPGAACAPHSSLVHMFDTLKHQGWFDSFEFAGCVQPDGTWKVNEAIASDFLRSAELSGIPVLLLGTAFSYVHLLDSLCNRHLHLKLPAGSKILETGGYKGRSRALTKPELYAYISGELGVSPGNITSEYGMSELSSQAYDHVRVAASSSTSAELTFASPRVFRFPPWAKYQIISPETGREVSLGQTGLLRIFDLANVYSVLAIQTEDLAVRRDAGFELVGRASISEPRGCSLMLADQSVN